MTALALFPARIRFVNADGTLTPEAYRALQEIVQRTGGVLGTTGSDTFGDITGGDLSNSAINVAYTDVTQSPSDSADIQDIVLQWPTLDETLPDIVQAGPIGLNASITSAALVGKTITVQDGLIVSFI
jgi:hypothetical protein